MPRRVECLELDRTAHLDDVAAHQAAVYATDAPRGAGMRQHAGARRRHDLGVSGGVIQVLMGVEDLGDGEAMLARGLQALVRIERIDDQSFTGLRAGDQVVEVSQVVRGPDSFDQHAIPSRGVRAAFRPGGPHRTVRVAT